MQRVLEKKNCRDLIIIPVDLAIWKKSLLYEPAMRGFDG